MAETLRAAIYARISADQERQGLGVQRQLKDCRALAVNNGWTVVGEYVDNDLSAFSTKVIRPEYDKLQEAMKAAEVDVVVAWATDRLFRRSRQLEDWIDLCEATGISIYSVQQGTVDLSTPSGRAVARAMTAFASLEVENLKARVKRKALELAESGAWPGQRVYGYERDGTVVPEEADIIREMADRVLAGEGFNAIGRDLDARGIRTISGSRWRASTIQGILRAPRIAGLRVHNGEVVAKGNWEPIISEEVSAVLRSRLAPGRSNGSRGGRRKHLLVGILACGRCGTGMVRGFGGKTRTPNYRCPANQGSPACGRTTIVAKQVEEWITDAALHAHASASSTSEHDESTWLERTRELAAKREQLGADFAEGHIDRDVMLAGMKRVRELEAAMQPPKVSRTVPATTADNLRSIWLTLPTSRQRSFIESAIAQVIIHPVIITTGAKRFDPNRIEIVWRR